MATLKEEWKKVQVEAEPVLPDNELLAMLDAHILSIRRRNVGRRRSIFYPLLHAREVTGLRCCRNACSYRIQIHVRHTGRNGRFIEQNLCSKSSFPKSSGNLIVLVPASCNRLGQTSHEP